RVEGFYSCFFPYFLLLGAIQACMLGAVLIAKEERDHSADFLFAKPVTRNRVVTAKLLAGLFQALVFNLVTLAASVYHVEQYNTSGAPLAGRIAVMMLALFVFQVTFLAVGIAFGANLRNARGATSAAAGVILGTYFLSVGIDMNGKLGFLRYLTPFKYFPAQDLMSGESIAWWALLLCAVWTAASLACAYMRFKRRDLTV
ncbi:MAG: ABC transporter permease subunit, partial [Clostridia bacterium]|nr:ABC transporter permease subunit [Clostridia bacterium]